MGEASILTLLGDRAGLQGDDTAVTFVDYEASWEGSTESLTYSQLYRRACGVARALGSCGSPGDRALILAPQGLDYIVAFFGALKAGLIAVPLAVPLGGVSDDRVSSVLQDAEPTVVLTTSAVAGVVTDYVRAHSASPPVIVEVDALDLDAPGGAGLPGGSVTDTAYLQYTSGSTRNPAGVMMSHQNLLANFEQLMSGYFAEFGNVVPEGSTIVSWLPFYHDMGLYLGVCGPVLAGVPAVLMSPVAFLQRPARWMQMLATHGRTYTAAPNFAFELAVRKTSDADMAGLDLSDVLVIITGSERVHPATLERFTQRFARQNLSPKVIRPSYGMAEATVYIATRESGESPAIVRFESEALTEGAARRCQNGAGTPLVSYGIPIAPMIRIVDPESLAECPSGTVGEIWVHGDNVASGYWRRPEETESTFGGRIVNPAAGTPEGPWLRTGDSGFVFDDELFIIGRIKDLLIVYGRNHSPDDIEATIQEVSRSRCAAIAVPDGHTEKLVVIIEVRKRAESPADQLSAVKRDVTSAIFNVHSLGVADLVLVPPGSIPITTSGKVRRAACVDQYRQGEFARLDA
ncbi:AMP-binding protein [Mycolicibacterium boenickei]|uniref:AMP-binding protein n=1 Tax=Mycolicibacterium boenickei TaxID=146017 RepID=A0AAX2ZVF5_9MYCO|nr:AMP-binding protein [Mycolicibacterium boenickei]PEG61276.1 acyl-CoA synthetase [Mycolicibacterium boenickei]UNB99146.1 AMP-binding protein [Mycolicibacterium boenickei]BBX88744.1 long-chain-fatty-acid--AMP ligase FadD28 [Mycolicibacterium boenickei]